MTLRKGNYRKLLECCVLFKKGFGLTFFGPPTSVFGEPRVTLGDSIELFAIVTSPSPFMPEELDFLVKVVD